MVVCSPGLVKNLSEVADFLKDGSEFPRAGETFVRAGGSSSEMMVCSPQLVKISSEQANLRRRWWYVPQSW
ncbi:hypothetical protein M378DRAFT_170856 [Amanita muscaria Koide BX008]|uniref:Uncharacterized protein n=1 Tax=Amanita muscaria (strain Koide BX008) TaxID=946122 RepID=A0A0C2WAD5_AMAMK|nr:hypothetical protein M378DRAFT_170856 [Amanita muscaria Koide BX008]